jgi:hypothetical protein
MGMDVEDRVGLATGELSALASELTPLGSLHALLQWGLRRDPPIELLDVVVQDEFTHDVVMRWSEGLFLVFDTT